MNFSQGNPYSPEQLEPLQRAAGRSDGVPVMMWNPPYTLPIAMFFGFFPFLHARMLWLLFNLSILLFSAGYFWQVYDGGERRWFAWLIALTFYPSIALLQTGQIGAVTLAGVVLFLYFLERENDFLAGMFTILAAVKPHVSYLFWIILLLWILYRRKWVVLSGVLAGALLMLFIPWAINPDVFAQYLFAVANHPPLEWATPTLGGLLRFLFGKEIVWLQFAPSLLGAIWAGWFWLRNRQAFEWHKHLPLVMLVSVVTAAYGWSSDKVAFLMIPIGVAIALQKKPLAVSGGWIGGVYLLIQVVGLIVHQQYGVDAMQMWLGPVFLLWYIFVRKTMKDLQS